LWLLLSWFELFFSIAPVFVALNSIRPFGRWCLIEIIANASQMKIGAFDDAWIALDDESRKRGRLHYPNLRMLSLCNVLVCLDSAGLGFPRQQRNAAENAVDNAGLCLGLGCSFLLL
jgi:hypothetical protein